MKAIVNMEKIDKVVAQYYEPETFPSPELEKKILGKFDSEEYAKITSLIEREGANGNTGSQEPSLSFSIMAERISCDKISYSCEIFCFVSVLLNCFTIIEANDISVGLSRSPTGSTSAKQLHFPRVNVAFMTGEHYRKHRDIFNHVKQFLPHYRYISNDLLCQPIPFKANVNHLEQPRYWDALLLPGADIYTFQTLGYDKEYDEFAID